MRGLTPFRLIALALALLAPAVHAEETKPAAEATSFMSLPIAVIDMQRVMQGSSAIKDIQRQLEEHRARFQKQITEQENQLTMARAQLQEERKALTDAAFDERKRQLQRQLLTVERDVQERRRALDQAMAESMGKARETLLNVIQQIATERKLSLVLTKQQIVGRAVNLDAQDTVLWHDSSLDLTDAVLSRFNQKLPSVAVSIKASAPAAAAPKTLEKKP